MKTYSGVLIVTGEEVIMVRVPPDDTRLLVVETLLVPCSCGEEASKLAGIFSRPEGYAHTPECRISKSHHPQRIRALNTATGERSWVSGAAIYAINPQGPGYSYNVAEPNDTSISPPTP